ncbi:hypothetical protein ACFYY3_01030 [Streptomyces sp. NPDC001812]|uniref:hypothetical protein n=1 Tax=Streptomyces sp. NPDC001812 TaxID=3364611 RepID=UPI00367866FB
MSFPPGLPTTRVTYRAASPSGGGPATGTVTFAPTAQRIAIPEHGVVFTGAGAYSFNPDGELVDAEGTVGVQLLPNDLPGTNPRGWMWRVTEQINGTPVRTHYIALSVDQPEADLSAIQQLSPDTPTYVAVPGPRGAAGPPGEPGEPGEPGPRGEPGDPASNLVQAVNGQQGVVELRAANVGAVPGTGGTVTGALVVDRHGAPAGHPIGQAGAAESLSVTSSFAGGEDEGQPGQFDSTGRLNLYSYQRADVGSYGETIRHFAMRKDSKQMEAWYFPSGGYDANREPVGSFKPVVWAGAHWEANNHASNHKHWSVETPSSTGSIETRFEVRFGNPNVDNAIAGLDKTLIATNLADFVVRCTNDQEMRLTSPNGQEKRLVFSRDPEGSPQWRRWVIRSTNESETGANAGSNFQIGRYDDTGTLLDTPFVISRSTGNVTLGPGLIARRASASQSSLSLNTASLGGGVGVLAIGNAGTAPASNPTGGGVLYAEGGALKWRGPSGTVTTVAPA